MADEKATETKAKGDRPDYRLVQVLTDKDGKPEYKNVGGIWEEVTSKNGTKYRNVRIGGIELLMFKNEYKDAPPKK